MAATVNFTYNGSTTLVAVCTGLTPSTSYEMSSGDPGSTSVFGTSNGSGALTLTITTISGLSAGDSFLAEVFHHIGDSNPAACIILKYGSSGSADQGIGPLSWSYDGGGGGTGVVSVTFPTVNAIVYHLQVDNNDGGTVTGDGTAKTLLYSALNYGTETSFDAFIYDDGTPTTSYAATLFESGVAGPGFNGQGAPPSPAAGRVLIAFDDGPLVADPTWTVIDQGGSFPVGFVSGYDITSGRQTLLAQTDTGSATVYINDHELALFDPRNASSPYFGKLDGRQIILQLYDPIAATWNSQFRGHIDNVAYDIDATASDENGDPINASIQLECVDIFDYLAGYGLTPGLDGVSPPAGSEDSVYYAQTTGSTDDRIIEILADVGIDSTRSIVFSGNVSVQAAKYNADESALIALRDACDAEIPFIANMYVDRFGRFVFHGRYARFEPAAVANDAGNARWDWHDWQLGDGKAVLADPTRTQIRVLSYSRGRSEVINVAVAYPANMPAAQYPSQVYADTTSITDYGKHAAPPMSDLLVQYGINDATANYPETLKYAELLVKNQKDPRESITAIQLKSINTATPHAANVWSCLTKSDVSDVANVAVGYPDGTGFTGASTADDYFIEGRQMTVRPANPSYDYVELNLELSPFVWSADTHSVFPPRG